MIAADTNVLIRVMANDDTEQARLAAAMLKRNEQVFISKTVLLEVEWVLRSAYKLDSSTILNALREFLDRPNVELEDESAVRHALNWCQQGMDFADAMHLASAGAGREFLTFDTDLIKKARQLRLRAKVVA